MDIDELKKIISKFLICEPDQIENDTRIDATAIKGSVLILRMYSRINDCFNIEINDFQYINTFHDLLEAIKENSH